MSQPTFPAEPHKGFVPPAKNSSYNADGTKKHYHPTNDVHRFALDNKLNSLEFNIVKYVTRHSHKNGLDDLKKAQDELARLIKETYDTESNPK